MKDHEAEALSAAIDACQRGERPVEPSPEAILVRQLLDYSSTLDPDEAQVQRIAARLGLSAPQASTTTIIAPKHDMEKKTMTAAARANHRFAHGHTRDRRLTLSAAMFVLMLAGVLILYVAQPSHIHIEPLSGAAPTSQPATGVEAPNPLPLLTGAFVSDTSGAMFDRMRDTGIRWAATHVEYRETAIQGTLNEVSDFIERAHGRGMGVLVAIGGRADEAKAAQADDYAAFAAFMGELAALGPDAVEIWPQANLDRNWPTGEIDPASYVEMLHAAYVAIRQSNPDVFVITGAPAPTGAEASFPGQIMNDDRFYEGLAEAGAAQYADCIGMRYVEGITTPEQTSGDPRDDYPTRYLMTTLGRAASPFRMDNMPVCVTALGYMSWEGMDVAIPTQWRWASETTVENQADWLAQAIKTLAEISSVRVALVNIWRFDVLPDDPTGAAYAMIRPDGSCPACDAISALKGQ